MFCSWWRRALPLLDETAGRELLLICCGRRYCYILPLQRNCQLFFTRWCTERFGAPALMLCDVLQRKLNLSTHSFCEASVWFSLDHSNRRGICLYLPTLKICQEKIHSVSKSYLPFKEVMLTFHCLVLFKCLFLPSNRLRAKNNSAAFEHNSRLQNLKKTLFSRSGFT